jgi:hypothetical protein
MQQEHHNLVNLQIISCSKCCPRFVADLHPTIGAGVVLTMYCFIIFSNITMLHLKYNFRASTIFRGIFRHLKPFREKKVELIRLAHLKKLVHVKEHV